jgi:hypothetical protein
MKAPAMTVSLILLFLFSNAQAIYLSPNFHALRVLSLFQKTNGSRGITYFMPYCTDACHYGIANRFPKAQKGIFPLDDVYFAE